MEYKELRRSLKRYADKHKPEGTRDVILHIHPDIETLTNDAGFTGVATYHFDDSRNLHVELPIKNRSNQFVLGNLKHEMGHASRPDVTEEYFTDPKTYVQEELLAESTSRKVIPHTRLNAIAHSVNHQFGFSKKDSIDLVVSQAKALGVPYHVRKDNYWL